MKSGGCLGTFVEIPKLYSPFFSSFIFPFTLRQFIVIVMIVSFIFIVTIIILVIPVVFFVVVASKLNPSISFLTHEGVAMSYSLDFLICIKLFATV